MEKFKWKLSYCFVHSQRKGLSYLNDENDLEAFLMSQTGQTIETILHISNEPRVLVDGDVGINCQFVNNLLLVENLSFVDNEEDEDVEDKDEVMIMLRILIYGMVYF